MSNHEETAAAKAQAIHDELAGVFSTATSLRFALASMVYDAFTSEVDGRPFFHWLNCADWDTYCTGRLDLSPRHARRLIGVYDDFIIKLKIDEMTIADIAIDKLDTIRRVVKKFPEEADEWIEKARLLSRQDLIAEKRERLGLPDRQKKKKVELITPLDITDPDKLKRGGELWDQFVLKTSCLQHPEKKSERSHMPTHRGMGGKVKDPLVLHGVLPHCGGCNRTDADSIENVGMDKFLVANKEKTFRFLYGVIFTLLAEREDAKKEDNDVKQQQ